MQSYPKEFREKVLAYMSEGHTHKEAAKKFGVSMYSIRNWKRRQKDTGSLAPNPRASRLVLKIPIEQLRAYFAEHPDTTIQAVAEHFGCTYKVAYTAVTRSGIAYNSRGNKSHYGTIIVIDGKICSGKSTYAHKLCNDLKSMYLCVDEAILRVFGATPDMLKFGDAYSKLVEYVMELAVRFAEKGVNVVFETGCFTAAERDWYKDFFSGRGIAYEWRYLSVSDETWQKAIAQRNEAHASGKGGDTYPATDELLEIYDANYAPPERKDVDVWVDNNW